MSGGRWNYEQCNLGYEMFPCCDISYGLGDDEYHNYTMGAKEARRQNPMHDKQLSELVFDVLCLIYSADWCQSGDTGEDSYRADVKYFKKKWLNVDPQEAIKKEIDKSIEEAKEELYQSFLVGGENDDHRVS